MKKSRILFFVASALLLLAACQPDDPAPVTPAVYFKETDVDVGTHKLAAFSISRNSKYLVVFESGLGDDHTIWDKNNVALKISNGIDVITYDRAYRGSSEYKGPVPRDINQLQSELGGVIDAFADGRKVILVGHSLGGFIVRDWAIKNPTRVAGILFVDPSHEMNNYQTQADEDGMYDFWNTSYGPNFGATLEAREWLEGLEYMRTLGNLPDVPVIVLTAMKVEPPVTLADMQPWYDAHESLKNGVTDFTHVSVTNSGHMMMVDQPQTLIDYIHVLIAKMP